MGFLAIFLLSLTASSLGADRLSRETECLPEFGCFKSDGIIPVPQSPQRVNTHMVLYHRSGSTHAEVSFDVDHFDSQISTLASHVDSSKKTKVIIHGFIDSGSTAWVHQMRDAFLKKGDFNVIIVDWGSGSRTEYNHAVANTFLVGAELAKTLTYLHDHSNLAYADVHVIGHSLGAQVAGHAGHAINKIGRITGLYVRSTAKVIYGREKLRKKEKPGLDPAEPDFHGKPTDRRLDSSDATFVDIIHTDGSNFNGVSGYGLMDPVGHVDFYPNGGQHQPGCNEKPLSSALQNILHGHLSGAATSLTCSHSRAIYLFIESINSPCKFYGHQCTSFTNFDNGHCLGCPAAGCPVMGYDADQTSLRGSFFLSTSNDTPFCGHEYYVEVHVSHAEHYTYGELLITLMGSRGTSEELKFSRQNHAITRDQIEKHVVATHKDIGTITGVKVKFARAQHDIHTHGAVNEIRIQSVTVESTENTNSQWKFCGHSTHIHDSDTATFHSHRGC